MRSSLNSLRSKINLPNTTLSTLDGFYRYLDSITFQNEEQPSYSESEKPQLGCLEMGHALTQLFDLLERKWESHVEYRFEVWKFQQEWSDDWETLEQHRDVSIVNMIKALFRFNARRVTRYFYAWKRRPQRIISTLPVLFKKAQVRRKAWGFRKLHLVIDKFTTQLQPKFQSLSFFLRRKVRQAFGIWSKDYLTYSKSAAVGAQFQIIRFKTYQTQSLIQLSGIHKKLIKISYMHAIRRWKSQVRTFRDVGIINEQKISYLVNSRVKKLENDMGAHEDALIQGRLKSLIFDMCIQVLDEMQFNKMENLDIVWFKDTFTTVDRDKITMHTPHPRDSIEINLIEQMHSARYQYFVDQDSRAYSGKLVDYIAQASLQDISNEDMRRCYMVMSWLNATKIQDNVDAGLLHWVRDSIQITTEALSFPQKVQTLLRHVNTQAILDEVRHHEEYEPRSEFFTRLEQILNPKNRVRGESDLSDREFARNFETRKQEARKLRSNLKDIHQDFAVLLDVCAGDENTIQSISQSWYEELLLTIIFVEGSVRDLQSLVGTIVKRNSTMQPFEKLLSDLLLTESQSLALIAVWEGFPLWFSTHVLDVLLVNDRLTSQDQRDLAEAALDAFIDSMVFDSRLTFETVANYILVQYSDSEGSLNLLERAAMCRLEQIDQIKEYCSMNNIEQITQTVFKIISARELERGNTINALTFGANIKDKCTRNRVEQQLIQEALSGSTSVYDKISGLPFEVRNKSAVCRFLLTYNSFQTLLAARKLYEASVVLKQFFVEKSAPKEFWGRIFSEAGPIFDSDELAFSYNDMMEILNCYDSIKNPNYGKVQVTKDEIVRISGLLKRALRSSLEYQLNLMKILFLTSQYTVKN